jgi:hypothetical protein
MQEPYRNRDCEGSTAHSFCHAKYTHVSQTLWRGLRRRAEASDTLALLPSDGSAAENQYRTLRQGAAFRMSFGATNTVLADKRAASPVISQDHSRNVACTTIIPEIGHFLAKYSSGRLPYSPARNQPQHLGLNTVLSDKSIPYPPARNYRTLRQISPFYGPIYDPP